MAEVTLENAYHSFAHQYNVTGTKQLTIDRGGPTAAGSDLMWLHGCLFETCPGGGKDGGYAEVVLDNCPNATAPADCQQASLWTAFVSTAGAGNETMFKSSLSTATTCWALNIPSEIVPGDSTAQVVAYSDSSGACAAGAVQNSFSIGSGLLETKGLITPKCDSKDGCCVQADGVTSAALAMSACDASNALQHFTVESLKGGKPGHIRDKAGRCLSIKACKVGKD